MINRESTNNYLLKEFQLPSRIDELKDSFLKDFELRLYVKRDDLIHPVVSGNKWRKLKYNLLHLLKEEKEGLITFGGAYSNHLIAVAAACNQHNIPCVGIVRGDKESAFNSTLKKCALLGMKLCFVNRSLYRTKSDKNFIVDNWPQYAGYFMVPEGGANSFGIRGCSELMDEQARIYDHLVVSSGTATTALGILSSLRKENLIVFSALKREMATEEKLKSAAKHQSKLNQLHYFDEHEFGGFAKINQELIDFTRDFYQRYGIQLDLIYNAKMFFKLFKLIKQGYFPAGSKILCIHTGGLQGNLGMEERYQFKLFNSTC